MSHLDRLASDPKHFHFFQALRVIEAHFADAPRLGEARRAAADPVRLGQLPEMAFPQNTIESFRPGAEGKPARLQNLFFGLFGPHGPLPLHLTAYVRDRHRNHRDRSPLDFANIFNHRMMELFYRAWASGEPAPSFDRKDDDAFSDQVAALAGFMGAHFAERDAMPDLAKRHYAAHLANGSRHADGLVSMVASFFGTGVSLKQFVGEWLRLEPADRWQLAPGRPGARLGLGRSYHLGAQVWSRATRFSLRIGPLPFAAYVRLLPGGPAFAQLQAIVRNYIGNAMDFDVVLVLDRNAVPAPILGEGPRLGYTFWLGRRMSDADADDLLVAG
jgi:type VI secretion system protein ImpH